MCNLIPVGTLKCYNQIVMKGCQGTVPQQACWILRKNQKLKNIAKSKPELQKSKQCSESLQQEFSLVASLVLCFSHGNCIIKDELPQFFPSHIVYIYSHSR